MSAITAYERLSLDQQRAVNAPTRKHQIVIGGPGAGKSLVLVHRAKNLVDAGMPVDRIQLLTYTNALEEYLARLCEDVGLPTSVVRTYDSLMSSYYKQLVGGTFPRDGKRKKDFDAIRAKVAVALDNVLLPPQDFDAVLLDEGQDLGSDEMKVLRSVAQHVTVAMDWRQRLYTRGGNEQEVAAGLGLPGAGVHLLDSFRCSESVMKVASAFLEDDRDRERLINAVAARGSDRASVLALTADRASLDVLFHDALKERTAAGERCCVLVGRRHWGYGVADGLRQAGFEVQGPDPRHLNLDSNSIPVLTFHSAKGLTFDSVFMPRLVDGAFGAFMAERRRSALFVAATRATRYLFLGAYGEPIPEIQDLQAVSVKHLARLDALVTDEAEIDLDWDPAF